MHKFAQGFKEVEALFNKKLAVPTNVDVTASKFHNLTRTSVSNASHNGTTAQFDAVVCKVEKDDSNNSTADSSSDINTVKTEQSSNSVDINSDNINKNKAVNINSINMNNDSDMMKIANNIVSIYGDIGNNDRVHNSDSGSENNVLLCNLSNQQYATPRTVISHCFRTYAKKNRNAKTEQSSNNVNINSDDINMNSAVNINSININNDSDMMNVDRNNVNIYGDIGNNGRVNKSDSCEISHSHESKMKTTGGEAVSILLIAEQDKKAFIHLTYDKASGNEVLNTSKIATQNICSVKDEENTATEKPGEEIEHNIPDEELHVFYNCVMCNYRTESRIQSAKHSALHADHDPFTCNLCTYKFSNKNNLESHIILKHGVNNLTCKRCSVTFSSDRILNRHIVQLIHAQEFMCTVCSLRSKSQSDLKAHVKAHNIRSQYCGICTYTQRRWH